MAPGLLALPAECCTLAEWAGRLALSERSLARLVVRETGQYLARLGSRS